MSRVCCVCTESKEGSENPLFRCGGQPGQGCGIVVHQACYGIITPPTGVWFCRKCESQERAARVKCELCPRKDGALKRTDSGGWAHVVCALYIPEVTFGNLRTMEPVITSKLPRERFAKTCSICEHKGLETTGACMSCHKSNCRLAFHVTCAQRENLLVEEEDQRDSRNIIYCGYCHTHYRRMMRQKRKQSLLRKNTTEGESGGVTGNANVSGGSHAHFVPIGGTDSDDAITEKPRHKNTTDNRLTKRSHIDVQGSVASSTGTVQKRKFSRKRKISSSNESTTSEAMSNASEAHNMVASPSGVARIHSPSTYYASVGGGGMDSSKRPAPDDGDQSNVSSVAATTGNFSGDCDNLDLLASVTQRVNMHQTSSSAPVTSKKSRSHSSTGVPPTNSSPLRQHHAGSNAIYSSAAAGGGSAGKKKRVSTAASTKQQKNSAVVAQPPPKSLEELLERQWEQTAQFILDQAGSKNNAGVMLAHLHELQSENRKMQARIMELASQREFFIATNGRLRQTLMEGGGISRVLNGIQLLSSEGHAQNSHDGDEAMEVDGSDVSQAQHCTGSGGAKRMVTSNDTSSGVSQSKSSSVSSHGPNMDVDVHPHSSHSSSVSGGTSSHEVTHVTNSVQGPIATYTALPNLVSTVPIQRNPPSE